MLDGTGRDSVTDAKSGARHDLKAQRGGRVRAQAGQTDRSRCDLRGMRAQQGVRSAYGGCKGASPGAEFSE